MFHNLDGHNAHFLNRELGKRFNKDDIRVIGENEEGCTAFNVKINVKLSRVMKMVKKYAKIFS